MAAENTIWLFLDKIIRLIGGLFVGIWVTRYLGPEQFGAWNYAIAFSALFSVMAGLGLDGIIIRDIVKYQSESRIILGTSFALKGGASLLSFTASIIAMSLIRSGDKRTLILVSICSFGGIFQSINVIDFYFRARTQGKYSVIAQDAAFLISSGIKIELLILKSSLYAFAIAASIESALAGLFLIFSYKRYVKGFTGWHISARWMKSLLKDGWPLIFSGILVTIFMRIDQLMIGQLIGDREVGVYSAAVRISEIWYIIPGTILSAVFPMILEMQTNNHKKYERNVQILYTGALWISLITSVIITFTGSSIIHFLYGEKFIGAAKILSIHIWTGVIVAVGSVWSQCILADNMQKLTIIVYASTAAINITLNFLLIPKLGAVGAAWSTLIGYAISQQIAFLWYKPRDTYCAIKNAIFFEVFRR